MRARANTQPEPLPAAEAAQTTARAFGVPRALPQALLRRQSQLIFPNGGPGRAIGAPEANLAKHTALGRFLESALPGAGGGRRGGPMGCVGRVLWGEVRF